MADIKDIIKKRIFSRSGNKIKRDSFLYLESHTEKLKNSNFAQCKSCIMWTGPKHKTCTIHGKDIEILADHVCGFYVPGSPEPEMVGHEMKAVTPKDSGLVLRQVRCENCVSFKPGENGSGICILFQSLNEAGPENFDLDARVHKFGCCNAQRPKE